MDIFNGRGYDLTLMGGIASYEVGFMGLILFSVVALHLAIRFTRRDEDAGRTDLVTAAPVGRSAPLCAAAAAIALWLTAVVAAGALGLQAVGLPARGSWLYLLSLALYVGAYAAVGLLAAQVARDARTAYGLGLAVVLASFLVRAVIDARGVKAAWASPMAWLAEVRPWGPQTQVWPFAAYAVTIATAAGPAAVVALRRDLGGGLLAGRPGPARGGRGLAGPATLAWRLTRTSWVGGWSVPACEASPSALWRGRWQTSCAPNPQLMEVTGASRPEDFVVSLAVLLSALGACCFGVGAVATLAAEESSGRLGLVLSTRRSRARVWAAWLSVTAAASTLLLVATTLALGAATASSTGEGSATARALGAGAALTIPVLLVIAIAAAGHALRPAATALGWAVVAWVLTVGMLAQTLRLPEWARNASPVYAAGRVPIDDPRPGALALMAALTLALLVAAWLRFTRRELRAG